MRRINMNINEINKRNSDTIAWILGFNAVTKKKLEDYINERGVKYVLNNYRTLKFSIDEIERIGILKRVLEKIDGDIDTINFGDVDEF